MKQITEDYVSFETARLLKEKGFDCKCRAYYIESEQMGVERFMVDRGEDYNHSETYPWLVSCSTLQMAMAWLREVHNIHIEIYRTACGYLYIISNIPYGTDLYNPEYGGDDENSGQWTTYEKAVEAAILYILKNLI